MENKVLEITARNNISFSFSFISAAPNILKVLKFYLLKTCNKVPVLDRIVQCYLLMCGFFPLMVEFQVLAGLNKKAFHCFSCAVRKPEEEVQSQSMDHVDMVGVVDAYMTLISFCDQYLRREEEGLLG